MKLRHIADLRALAWLAVLMALLCLNWTGVYRSAWSYLVTFPLAFLATIICHNHIHLGLFRRRPANQALSVLLSFATGNPPSSIITAHNVRHHRHCDSELDFVRTTLAPFRKHNWLNVLVFPFLSCAAMWREKESDLRAWRKHKPILYCQALRERIIFLGFVATVLVLDWQATLTYLVAPWVFGQLCIVGINLVQHQGCDQDSEFNHSRNITGRFSNWLFFNSGFHTAHYICFLMYWSKLPAFHRREIAPHIDPQLNHRTLLGAIINRLAA